VFKYIRFQMARLFSFILVFLGAYLFHIVSGGPFLPLQTLYINFTVDLFLAIRHRTGCCLTGPDAVSTARCQCPESADSDIARDGRTGPGDDDLQAGHHAVGAQGTLGEPTARSMGPIHRRRTRRGIH
jgi:hypothetical protein